MRTKTGIRPLHVASSKSEEIVRILVEHGADTNALDSNGMAPLHRACKLQDKAIVAALLKHRANVNLPTRGGARPLHIAVSKGREEIVRMLVEHGADVDAVRQMDGSTPLHIACLPSRYHGRANLIDLLLNQQANISVPDSSGLTPLHVASSLSSYHDDRRTDFNRLIHTIESFLKHGADIIAG